MNGKCNGLIPSWYLFPICALFLQFLCQPTTSSTISRTATSIPNLDCADTDSWDDGLGNDCIKYAKSYCDNGAAKTGYKYLLESKWYNHPENNCCVCGKGKSQGTTSRATAPAATTPTETTAAVTTTAGSALWDKEATDMRCDANRIKYDVSSQLECQKKCDAISACPGISYSHTIIYICYICLNDILSNSVQEIGFYRKLACKVNGLSGDGNEQGTCKTETLCNPDGSCGVAQEYSLSDRGQICSEAGRTPVEDLKDCKKAVTWIQSEYWIQYGSTISGNVNVPSNVSSYPRGCFVFAHSIYSASIYFTTQYTASHRIFFNPQTSSRQVCKAEVIETTSRATTPAATTPTETTAATTTTADPFFFGNQGQHDCPGGAFIRDQTMCKRACTQLVLPLKEIFGGFVCYKDYRGYCFQNGQNGGGASMVCKQTP